MKFYLRQQRISQAINIKEFNKLLNLDDDEPEKDIICNIDQINENNKTKEKIYKTKKSTKKSKRKSEKAKTFLFTNESGISMQSNFLMNKENSINTKQKYS